jgi:ADP-heptose:LPS heptosyltransferase
MGSGSEMKELRKIRSDIGKGAFLSDPEEFGVSPRDSIYLSMACLQNCELSFSCMSGGGHLAAALGVRTLVFAPYERLHKFAPLGPNVWSLYTDISCTPCKVRGRLPCKGERWCVHAISPEIAAEAILYCISLPKNESLVSDTQGSVRSC